MLADMERKYEAELTNFLYRHVLQKEYFIAWLPETRADISALNKDDFVLCIEEGKIVGCMGTYLSHEQKVVRLLGPVVRKEFFDQYVDSLYARCIRGVPKEIAEARIAFFEENGNCRWWCERNRFELYNAEITMVLDRKLFVGQATPQFVTIRPFERRDRNGLESIHPKGTFYTLDELIEAVSPAHHLLLAIVRNESVGYIYYEQSADGTKGEISLLHVGAGFRRKGYGTMLLRQAVEHLLQIGVEDISISVRVANTSAHDLYKRIGFSDRDTVYAYKKPLEVQDDSAAAPADRS